MSSSAWKEDVAGILTTEVDKDRGVTIRIAEILLWRVAQLTTSELIVETTKLDRQPAKIEDAAGRHLKIPLGASSKMKGRPIHMTPAVQHMIASNAVSHMHPLEGCMSGYDVAGYHGIGEDECNDRGCCWGALEESSVEPWCYRMNCEDPTQDVCSPDEERIECGFYKITQEECEERECCWSPLEEGSEAPWCFFKNGLNPHDTCCPAYDRVECGERSGLFNAGCLLLCRFRVRRNRRG